MVQVRDIVKIRLWDTIPILKVMYTQSTYKDIRWHPTSCTVPSESFNDYNQNVEVWEQFLPYVLHRNWHSRVVWKHTLKISR